MLFLYIYFFKKIITLKKYFPFVLKNPNSKESSLTFDSPIWAYNFIKIDIRRKHSNPTTLNTKLDTKRLEIERKIQTWKKKDQEIWKFQSCIYDLKERWNFVFYFFRSFASKDIKRSK